MRALLVVTVLLFLCAISPGCKIGEEAGGKETVIVVVASDEDWSNAGPVLDGAFSVRERTLHAQKYFDLMHVSDEDLELYKYRKNILLMGSVDSDLMDGVLSEDAKVMVRSGESYMFGSLDGWIPKQIIVMIAAPEDRPLADIVRTAGPSAFRFFEDNCLERIRRRIYSAGIEEGIKADTRKRYGWSVDLPKGYSIASDDSASIVTFIRHNPERVLLVYWGFDKGERSWADIRDEMSARHVQGDKIYRDIYKETGADFRGYRATRVTGHWENEAKVIGGPFVSYCFEDTATGIYYMVDYNIFAPAKKKWPILGQMEWITQTFKLYRKE